MAGYIFIWLIMLVSLYFVIKWAVRTAILEADDMRANLNSAKVSKKDKAKCPSCGVAHFAGHSKCPHCLYQY